MMHSFAPATVGRARLAYTGYSRDSAVSFDPGGAAARSAITPAAMSFASSGDLALEPYTVVVGLPDYRAEYWCESRVVHVHADDPDEAGTYATHAVAASFNESTTGPDQSSDDPGDYTVIATFSGQLVDHTKN